MVYWNWIIAVLRMLAWFQHRFNFHKIDWYLFYIKTYVSIKLLLFDLQLIYWASYWIFNSSGLIQKIQELNTSDNII